MQNAPSFTCTATNGCAEIPQSEANTTVPAAIPFGIAPQQQVIVIQPSATDSEPFITTSPLQMLGYQQQLQPQFLPFTQARSLPGSPTSAAQPILFMNKSDLAEQPMMSVALQPVQQQPLPGSHIVAGTPAAGTNRQRAQPTMQQQQSTRPAVPIPSWMSSANAAAAGQSTGPLPQQHTNASLQQDQASLAAVKESLRGAPPVALSDGTTAYADGDDTNLIVNYLPKHYDDDALRKLFAGFGPIRTARIIRDPETRGTRGFGFVRFCEVTDAVAAIKAMTGHRIGAKRIKVGIARPSGKIRVRNGKVINTDSLPVDEAIRRGELEKLLADTSGSVSVASDETAGATSTEVSLEGDDTVTTSVKQRSPRVVQMP